MENIVKTIKQEKMITGIDSLGRIIIPKELRESSKINTGDKLYIYINEKNIILEKSNAKIEHGVLRTIDEFGRYVIPIELRNELKIKENDSFKICKKDDKIILIKE